jgi:hypothetical protein
METTTLTIQQDSKTRKFRLIDADGTPIPRIVAANKNRADMARTLGWVAEDGRWGDRVVVVAQDCFGRHIESFIVHVAVR